MEEQDNNGGEKQKVSVWISGCDTFLDEERFMLTSIRSQKQRAL